MAEQKLKQNNSKVKLNGKVYSRFLQIGQVRNTDNFIWNENSLCIYPPADGSIKISNRYCRPFFIGKQKEEKEKCICTIVHIRTVYVYSNILSS